MWPDSNTGSLFLGDSLDQSREKSGQIQKQVYSCYLVYLYLFYKKKTIQLLR